MKTKRLLAYLLAIVLIVAQFTCMVNITAFADGMPTALSSSFLHGVNLHHSGYGGYEYTYSAIFEAKALGSNIIRINYDPGEVGYNANNLSYLESVVDFIKENNMQVVLVLDGLNQVFRDNDDSYTNAVITENYTTLASTLAGKVDYYQIGNEIDNIYEEYNTYGFATKADVAAKAASALGAAKAAINAEDPSAEIILNFCWTHTKFLRAVYNQGYRWDVTGYDLYSNIINDYRYGATYYETVINAVVEDYSVPVMICETNLVPRDDNNTGTFTYDGNVNWLITFANYCQNNTDVIGFIMYELYDEGDPYNENDEFQRENCYGLFDKDKNEKAITPYIRALFGGTADSRVYNPAAPATSYASTDRAIDAAGVAGHQGKLFTWLNGSITKSGLTPVDISNYLNIEFDLYIENYDDFMLVYNRAGFNTTAGTSSFRFRLLNTESLSDNRAYTDFDLAQITHSGWNHISIPFSVFSKLHFDPTSVTGYDLFMEPYNGNNSYLNATSGMVFAVKNLYATGYIPPMVDKDPRFDIYEGVAISSTLGSTAKTGQAHPNGYSSGTPAEVVFTNTGLSGDGYNSFEFDCYIENYANFTARNAKLYVNLRDMSASKATVDFTNKITTSGWNHIAVSPDLNDATLDSVIKVRFYTDIDAGSTGATDSYRLANICATVIVDPYNNVPAMIDASPKFDIYEGAAFSGTFGSSAITGQGHLPGYSPAQKTFAAGSTAGYGCFEFDFYLDDISIIAARNTKLYLNLRSGSGNGTSRGIYEFQDQLTANGWNHVKVKTGLADDKLEILTMARFYIDIDAGSTGAADRYRIANICATKEAYSLVPDMIEASPRFDIFEGAAVQCVLGSEQKTGQAHLPGYNSTTPAQKTFTNTGIGDLGFDVFEFDFYVDNVATISARNVKLYFNLRTPGNVSKATFEFQNQIIADGWNHVKIATGLSTSVLNEIGMTRFFIDMDAGSTGATDRLRVANICATQDLYNNTPAMVDVTPKFDVFDGVAFEGTFGSSAITGQGHLPGYSPAQKTFAAGSVSGCDCFEFDFYLDDVSIVSARNVKLYLNLRSGSGAGVSKGTYEFQSKLTASGWNHVRIYTALSSDVIDTLTMARFYIDIDAGDNGAADRYRVANICATKFATPEKHNTQGTTVADLNAGNGLTNSGWKEGRYNSAGCYQENLTAVNLYGSDYIEFDMYVESRQGILDAIADLDEKNGDKNTRLRLLLSSTSGDYRGSNYTNVFYLDSFEDYIINDGWNHIAIPVSAFYHNGSATLTSISSWGIDYYEATNDTNIAKDQIISVYNICGTKAYTDVAGDVNNDGTASVKDYVAAKLVITEAKAEYNPNIVAFNSLGLEGIREIIME